MLTRNSSRPTLFCGLAAILLFSACAKTEEKPAASASAPSAASQPAPTPPVTAAAPVSSGAVIASAQYSNDPDLRCDLLEVKRVSGGALLVRWRVVNAAAAGSTGLVTGAQPKAISYDFSWEQLYFTDPAENKKYEFLKDSENQRILDVWWGSLPAGQQRANWAKFPAPPPTSSKITVQIPKFPPFEDVPVS